MTLRREAIIAMGCGKMGDGKPEEGQLLQHVNPCLVPLRSFTTTGLYVS
jgi:hypothetical protein